MTMKLGLKFLETNKNWSSARRENRKRPRTHLLRAVLKTENSLSLTNFKLLLSLKLVLTPLKLKKFGHPLHKI